MAENVLRIDGTSNSNFASERILWNTLKGFSSRVLRTIYELQFVGRPQAVATLDDAKEIVLRPTGDGRMRRFKMIPIVALLAEFYEQSSGDSELQGQLCAAVKYLDSRDLIRRIVLPDSETEIDSGLPCPLDVALGAVPYVRPDGMVVAGFLDILTTGQLKQMGRYGGLNVIDRLGLTARSPCEISGVRLDGTVIYEVLRRLSPNGGCRFSDPCVQMVFGYPAAMAGFPPNDNYEVTKTGIEVLESDADEKALENRNTVESLTRNKKKETGSKPERLSETQKDFLGWYSDGHAPATIQEWANIKKSQYYNRLTAIKLDFPKLFEKADYTRNQSIQREKQARQTKTTSTRKSARLAGLKKADKIPH